MFLELTGTNVFTKRVVINSDKIIYFTSHNNGTRLWLDDKNEETAVYVTESLDFIMNCLQD